MISTKNLLLNIIPQADASKDAKSNSKANSLNLTIDKDQKEEDTKRDNSIDPHTFMMLLSQMFSNLPEQAANPALEANKGDTSLSTDANTLISQAQQKMLELLDINTNQNAQGASDPNQINDNPAVSWIDSQSFQALAGVDQANASAKKALDADKALLLDNGTNRSTSANRIASDLTPSSDLLSSVLSKNDQKTDLTNAVDSAVLTNTAGDKFKGDMMQTLQQLSAGVIGAATTETSKKTAVLTQDAINAANNTQTLVTPNQLNHAQGFQAKTLEIAVPINDPQWNNKLSDHIVWLGQNDIKSAVIKIHPEELGPLEINVKVDKNSASVNIISHSPQVRDLVDQAIPRLRDMMLNQGLYLSDVQVNADQRSNQFAQNNNNNNGQQHEHSSSIRDSDDEVQLVTSVKTGPKRLVDYFA